MIEMTHELLLALWCVLPSEVQEGRELDDIEPWVEAVLRAVEQGYQTARYCNNELMPGVQCKRIDAWREHKHEATLPATGNRVVWS